MSYLVGVLGPAKAGILSFETAIERALARNQEGLSTEEIIKDYHNIYFAAQKIHLATDNPRSRCDFIFLNDHRRK